MTTAAPFIVKEDCRKALWDLPVDSVDAVVTGIPFWSAKGWGWKGAIGGEASFPEYLVHLKDVLEALWRVTKESGQMWLVAGDCRARPMLCQPARLLPLLEEMGWKLRDTFIWSYRLSVTHYQVVYWLQKEPVVMRPPISSKYGYVWGLPMDQGDPVTFPVELVERCLELSGLDRGARVLDPFAGSGTVGRVAARLGHSAVLIDGRTGSDA